MDQLILIGTGLVGLITYFRFNSPPTTLLHSNGDESIAQRMKRWFSFTSTPGSLFPPPRANTTLFKYSVYRCTYTLMGVCIYLALIKIAGLSHEVDAIIAISLKLVDLNPEEVPNLADSGPLVIAFMLTVVLPKLPPFASADSFVRSLLYEQAAIPAQQFRELQRLKEAAFIPNQDMLEKVRTSLQEEGINVDDLQYDDKPSTRSLWTKTSLLIRHIDNWMTRDRYKTAFAVLKEINDTRRSVDVLFEMYKALMGDAKTILQDQRMHPGATMSEHEHRFRESVKTLLYHTYNLLSRVSLHAHFSEKERVKQMRRIGFQIDHQSLSYAPDANDLVMLMLIVGAVFVLPLSLSMENSALAPLIGIIVYSAVLIPVVVASELPLLTTRDTESNTPNVAFPVLCGMSAALFGAVLIMVYLYSDLGDIEMVAGKYYMRSPWAIIHAGIAVLVAWRMLTDLTPSEKQARIAHRSPPWGSITDAAIFLLVNLVLMVIVISLLDRFGTAPEYIWRPFLIIGGASAIIGYFVPSWYRTNNRSHNDRRATRETREKFNSRLQRHLTAS